MVILQTVAAVHGVTSVAVFTLKTMEAVEVTARYLKAPKRCKYSLNVPHPKLIRIVAFIFNS